MPRGRVVTQFDRENAHSVLKNTGRNGRYETVLHCWTSSCSGRPYFGRASVCSIQNQTESPPRGRCQWTYAHFSFKM